MNGALDRICAQHGEPELALFVDFLQGPPMPAACPTRP
jgi:hypothetical protein